MFIYLCRNCDTFHTWDDHPRIARVIKHDRLTGEDIWYCPNCNRQHRTTDGTMLGQVSKLWKEFNVENVDEFLFEREIYASEELRFHYLNGTFGRS